MAAPAVPRAHVGLQASLTPMTRRASAPSGWGAAEWLGSKDGWRNDMRLSPHERKILATIEDELARNSPALAVTFTETRLPLSFRQRFPLSKAHVCLLFLALLTLVLLHSIALGLGPAGSGVLTGALILPWLISASRANTTVPIRIRRRRRQNTRRARDVDAG
jgi:hypothetical protein